MSDARASWEREEGLFLAALELEPARRAGFLERECGADVELRGRVARLLAAHAGVAPDFLVGSPGQDFSGRRIGEFTLERLLGEGGMGAVYEATQDHPHRRVALKIVRALPGVTRNAQRLAFEAELMGRLQHPHVAQIHAAGTCADPAGEYAWFAMELVPDARDIVSYAEQHALGLDQRLALFDAVCQAVGHGHRRGVLHRDLKPANVLVDGAGRPKVIDFGIARATDPGGEATTASGEVRGTLAYMSPEQFSGRDAEVDTRCDVYALGVILYELLTGRRPIDLAGRSLTEAARLVQEQAPIPPSLLRRELAGDLETVLLKALAKEPERRYATAEELAEDLRRFRRHEPVAARRPGLAYQLRLFARRHRAAVSAAAAVLVLLVGATWVSLRSGLQAARAARAESEARRHAERVAGFLQTLFTSARPAQALGQPLTVPELLRGAVDAAESELADDPGALADVLGTLGFTHTLLGDYAEAEGALEHATRLARELGDPRREAGLRTNLGYLETLRGSYAAAEEQLLAARELFRAGAGGASEEALLLLRLGGLYCETSRLDLGEEALRSALARSEASAEVPGAVRGQVLQLLGDLAYQRRDYAACEEHQRAALLELERSLPADHPLLAGSRNSLANLLFDTGRLAEAETLWRATLAALERVLGPAHVDTATVLGNLALVHARRGQFEQAEDLYERVLAIRSRELGDHSRVASTLELFGLMLCEKGELDRARELCQEAVEVQLRAQARAGLPEDGPELAQRLFQLAMVQRRAGELEEAAGTLAEVERIQAATLGADDDARAGTSSLLGLVLVQLGRPAEAEPYLRAAHAARSTRLAGHWLAANTASVYGACLLALGRTEEAEPLVLGAVPVMQAALGPADFRVREAEERVRELRARTGRTEPVAPPGGAPRPLAEREEALARGWAQWRGPLATGVAPHADPPVRWSEGENVRWKRAVPGKGHSSPVLWGERVFLTTAVPFGDELGPIVDDAPGAHDSAPVTRRQRFLALALDRKDGAILWQATLREELPHEGGHVTGSYASASPATDGEVLIAPFGSRGLFALDLAGEVLWRQDLGRMATKHAHGEGSSPLLAGGSVVVVWDHEGESFVAAFDRRTGVERWRVARDEQTSWASPIAVEREGRTQVVVSGTKRIRAYDLVDGALLWQCGGLSSNVVCSPVSDGAVVFAGSSYESQALLAIDLARARGEITDGEAVLWARRRATPYVPSLLLVSDTLYFLHHYQGFLARVSARTGAQPERAFRLEDVDDVYASPVSAAGRVYVTDRSGLTVVLRHVAAGGGELEVLARNRLEDCFSASAALAGRELFLRGERSLYCLAQP
jgi:tetratricopeptide (TPR) repeat protein/outer membrane protein assembly factor BamB